MKNYLKLMRIHHYIKNGLIFLPIVFSRNLFSADMLMKCLAGFFSFSLIASAVYIINDIKDAENDRNHEVKKSRPIASGSITIKKAFILLAVVLIGGFLINYLITGFDFPAFAVLLLYFIINILYSNGLKDYPLIDVAILATGFLLRVIYGAMIINVEVSNWLYLTVISLSFYMGLGKRRNEIVGKKSSTRKVLHSYNYSFLDKNMYMCLALANVFYALWCVDKTVNNIYSGTYLIWSVPLVILICMKYSLNIEGDSEGDPVDVLLHDKVLLALVLIYMLFMMGIVYIFP